MGLPKVSLIAGFARRYLFETLLVSVVLYKMQLVERRFDTNDVFWPHVLGGDLFVIAGILALYAISKTMREKARGVAWILFGVSATLLLLYLVDIIVINQFTTRLFLQDVIAFFEVGAAADFLSLVQTDKVAKGIIILTLIMYAMYRGFLSGSPQERASYAKYALPVVAAFLVAGLSIPDAAHIKSWAAKNYIQVNAEQMAIADYSPEFVAKFHLKGTKASCMPVSSKPPKRIILLLVESLSNYHSQYFSGLRNYTPNIDKIAAENVAYKNFVANGFNTANGLVALLTGRLPVPSVHSLHRDSSRDSFDGYFGSQGSLPALFSSHGYTTAFLTSGDLGYSSKGTFLTSIGFEQLFGHDDLAYKDIERRYHFGSVPDEFLLQRAAQWATEQRGPFLAVVETVSSHHPYIEPHTEIKGDERRVWKYVDDQIWAFYERLQSSGFFTDGLLLILGDHRAMTPVKSSEIQLYGELAPAMIPLIVVNGERGTRNDFFQQTDLNASLRALVEHSYCEDVAKGLLLAKEAAPTCVGHALGLDRGNIVARCEGVVGRIKLDGDHTRYLGINEERTRSSFDVYTNRVNYELIFRRLPGFENEMKKGFVASK